MHRLLAAVALVALLLSVTVNPVGARTFATDSTVDQADVAPGDGVCATKDQMCTLRAAVDEANALAGADEITLLAGSYELDPSFGPLDVSDDLEIRGDTWQTTSVETTHFLVQPILHVGAASLTLRKLAVIAQVRGDGAIENDGTLTVTESYVAGQNLRGVGGILNRNVLVVRDSTIEGHFDDYGGTGAIASSGSLTILRSLITGAAGREGGVILDNGGDAFISDSIVRGGGTGTYNGGTLEAVRSEFGGQPEDFGCARILGGAIANHGTLKLAECSVIGSAACGGGALANFATAEIVASTLAGASDDSGGAVANEGALVFRNSTLSASFTNGQVGAIDNRVGGTLELHGCTITDNDGGGYEGSAGGVRGDNIAMAHTILAGNHGSPADCAGKILSLGHNLIGDATGCTIIGDRSTDLVGVDPLLGPLLANGGPTATHALLAGSPARDAGFPTGGPGNEPCEPTDQRGITRPQGAACDIGAVESVLCGDGKIGPGEECDDGNTTDGDCCSSTCTVDPDDSPCDDGNACTLADTCHAGICSSTAVRTCGACTKCDAAHGCVAKVLTTCRQPIRTISGHIEMTTKRTPKLSWKWTDGQATSRDAFHDPTAGGTFALCLFDESGATARVAFASETRTGRCGNHPCWRSTSASTFTYKDPEPTSNGIGTITLKSGKDGKAKILVDAKGPRLMLPTLPLALPFRAQFQAGDGSCWEAAYVGQTTTKNTAQQFRAKAFHP